MMLRVVVSGHKHAQTDDIVKYLIDKELAQNATTISGGQRVDGKPAIHGDYNDVSPNYLVDWMKQAAFLKHAFNESRSMKVMVEIGG